MSSDCTSRSSLISTNSQLPDLVSRTSENQRLLPTRSSDMEASDQHYALQRNSSIIDDPEYAAIAQEAERAIEGGVLPMRIAAGSSGSYFVRNLEGVRNHFVQSSSKALFCLDREPSPYSNQKTKNPTVDSIRSGVNGRWRLVSLSIEWAKIVLLCLGYRRIYVPAVLAEAV